MTQERPSLGFAEALDATDLTRFAPRPKVTRPEPTQAAAAASAAGFRSREGRSVPADAEPSGQGSSGSLQRRRRTGRSVQLNLKAKPETVTVYCAIADRMGWGLGETLEKAVELLQERYGKPA